MRRLANRAARTRRGGLAEDGQAGAQRWIVSYADFITLLFAFFTMLYGISTVDAGKLGKAVSGVQSAFNGGQGASSPDRPNAVRTPAPPATLARAGASRMDAELPRATTEVSLDDLRLRLRQRLAAPVRDERVAIDLDRRGLVVSIRESGSFQTGSAEVSKEARRIIGEVALAIRDIGNAVRIEGHTDDVPIHTATFASNWELSTARATNVVSLLVESHGIDAGRLSAAGYSEFHPRAPNDSATNRARNRRVDIVVLNPTVSQREEPNVTGLGRPPGQP